MTHGGWKWGWGLACSALVFGSCGGGQTGDAGDEEQCAGSFEETTLEAASAESADVSRAAEELFGESGERSFELLLMAPPELWTERDLEPPPDRSTQAIIRLTPGGSPTRFTPHASEQERSESCREYTLLPVSMKLELPEFSITVTGTADATVTEVGQLLWPSFDIPPVGERCAVHPRESDAGHAVFCSMVVWGATSCAESSNLLETTTDPQSGLGLQEAFDVLLSSPPTEFVCEGGSATPPRILDIRIPDHYCGEGNRDSSIVPATVTIADQEGGTRALAARAEWRPNAACHPADCYAYDACPKASDELDNRGECATAWLSVALPGGYDAVLLVEVQADGGLLVGQHHSDTRGDGRRCWAQHLVD